MPLMIEFILSLVDIIYKSIVKQQAGELSANRHQFRIIVPFDGIQLSPKRINWEKSTNFRYLIMQMCNIV